MNNDKKTILYVITQGHWGGAQRYVFDLATSLEHEYNVHVAVGDKESEPDLQKKLANTGIKVHQLKSLKRAISPVNDLRAIGELKKLYKDVKPDIIHLNSSKAGVLGSLASPSRKKTIYTAHGWVFKEPINLFKKLFYFVAEYISSHKTKFIITISKNDEKTGRKLSHKWLTKVERILIGIDKQNESLNKVEAREKLGLDPNLFTFGTVANFYKTKSLETLLEAIALCKEINVQWVIIGDGPERNHLESIINKKSLHTRVTLAGFKDKAADYLEAFDTFVLSSKKEGLPYTILESVLANVPIISTKVGGVPDVIEDKKTGLLVKPGDVESLAKAMIFAANHEKEMKEMADKLYQDKDKFSLERMVKQTKALY